MNGEERDELIKLKALTEEKWRSHDIRSEEIWKEIRGNIKGIFAKLDNLPCGSHTEKFAHMESSIARLWFGFTIVILVGIVLGIYAKALQL